jgi:hypothetical protein
VTDKAQKLRQRLNQAAEQERNVEASTVDTPADPKPWPYGWIAFGAVCAAVVIGLLVWLT